MSALSTSSPVLELPPNSVLYVDGNWVEGYIRFNTETGYISSVHVTNADPALVDGTLYVIPGLIDTHVHLTACTANLSELTRLPPTYVAIAAAAELKDTCARGFTCVRDAGGADVGISKAAAAGLIASAGTRVLFTGHAISQTGGHGDMRSAGEDSMCGCCAATARGIGIVADGVAECQRVTRDELRRGAHFIKIMASGGVASPTDRLQDLQFSDAEIVAICEEAARK